MQRNRITLEDEQSMVWQLVNLAQQHRGEEISFMYFNGEQPRLELTLEDGTSVDAAMLNTLRYLEGWHFAKPRWEPYGRVLVFVYDQRYPVSLDTPYEDLIQEGSS